MALGGEVGEVGQYFAFLKELGASGAKYFLEGGQAVNFWAEYYSARGGSAAIGEYRPFTSKDCDVWVSNAAHEYIKAKELGGTYQGGDNPADGQLGILDIGGAPPRTVDLLSSVYGVPRSLQERLVRRSLNFDNVWVIDPLYLFKSKCHCLIGLDQTGRQDEKHLRILCQVLPMHFEELLDEVPSGTITERNLIDELKVLMKILNTNRVKRAIEKLSVEPTELIPIERLKNCDLEKVRRFANTEWGDTERG